MEKMAEEYGKTSVQKKYLEKKYNEIKLPVEYESYSSWDTMIMYVETYSIIPGNHSWFYLCWNICR